MSPIPLSLYIHIPWCVRKCPYCDFNSHQADKQIPEELYVQALLRDLESELPYIWGRPLKSIFIGGGTPSLFTEQSIDLLMRGLRERLPLRHNMEITMEANPGTFEQQRFSSFRESGINRLSIGVQSFNNTHLQKLGRIHDASEAIKATEIAVKAGFNNFNLDLMFGLPGQTIEHALSDLRKAIEAQPSHISWYQLTIEENTLFHHAPPPALPDDELLWNMQLQGQALLKNSSYSQYEVSAYTKDDKHCLHNTNYWEFGDYLGIGAGAHSKITMPDSKITRHGKFRHPNKYIEKALQGKARSQEQVLIKQGLIVEFILNAIRLKQGFSKDLFENRTHIPFSSIKVKIDKMISDGLLIKKSDQYLTTDKGWLFINSIVEYFL